MNEATERKAGGYTFVEYSFNLFKIRFLKGDKKLLLLGAHTPALPCLELLLKPATLSNIKSKHLNLCKASVPKQGKKTVKSYHRTRKNHLVLRGLIPCTLSSIYLSIVLQ